MSLHCVRTNEARHPATGALLDVFFWVNMNRNQNIQYIWWWETEACLTDLVVNSRNSADDNDVDDAQWHL